MNRLLLLPIALIALFATVIPSSSTEARPRLSGHFDPLPAETDESLYGVRLFKNKRVVVCGSDGTIVRSSDGGKLWDPMQYREGLSFRVMHWVDERRAFFAGRTRIKNVLLRTTDGGNTFNELRTDVDMPIRGFGFLTPKRGIMIAGSTREKDGAWRVTNDGGSTWKVPDTIAYGITGRQLNDLCVVDEKHVFVVGSHVEVALVGDAARSLLYQKRLGGVLYSDDGGETWDVLNAGNSFGTSLWGVDFCDAKNGYVVGTGGFAARTTDGGKTWTRLDTGTDKRLRAVDVIDAETAYFVGDDGIAIGTNNGGESMVKLKTETKKDLRALSFVNERTGIVVGQTGTVLKFVRTY
jgi:photosystem II stability/assembly factor-like uncharacterized protein